MAHAIITRAHVRMCLHCGNVERVAPVRDRAVGPWTDGDCCPLPARDWIIETVVRVWPRLAAEALYVIGSWEADEFRGPEAWRLNPNRYEDAVLVIRSGRVVG